jgi:metal-sulfur cluster biosynthetic enzyme
LRIGRGLHRISRGRKGTEERIALRVHFDAVVRVHGRANQTPVLGECFGVLAAEGLEEPCRSLDVGEEERDGATRETHAVMIALWPRTVQSYTGRMAVTKDDVFEALRQVEDPELGMDIVDLGLLYDVEIDGAKVKVIHSLTSMGCPAGPMIQEDIHRVASEVPGVENVEVELTWDPPWTPEKMSEDAKFILGFG